MTSIRSAFATARRTARGLLPLAVLGLALQVQAQALQGISNDQLPAAGGPVKLSQPLSGKTGNRDGERGGKSDRERGNELRGSELRQGVVASNYRPSEFELFVRQLAGITKTQGERLDEEGANALRRFGVELTSSPLAASDAEPDAPAMVPDDYVLGAGDEVLLNLWGAVEANLRLEVDRGGRISIPRIGAVQVAGLRYGELREAISRRVATQFRHFDLSVALGQVRVIRVYVTGFVQRPGPVQVSSLSTMLRALMAAGGPSSVGSFRNIQLRRGGSVLASLDLYDLLLKGDRSADRALRSDDVVHVGPVGAQVGVIGSVNRPAVFELRNGDTVADALAMAGGLSTVANRQKAVVHRLDPRQGQALRDLDLGTDLKQTLENGDVLRVMSLADMAGPALKQSKRVRVEGEVLRPGDYVLPAGSTLRDALQAAGGRTAQAYLFGTEFSREAVRLTQLANLESALRGLETEFTRAAVTRKEKVVPPNDEVSARNLGQLQLIERLRAAQPSGRVVLQLSPESQDLPELSVEDGDRIFVPSRPSTVNVFGSVLNGGSYVFAAGRSLDQYLAQAGGVARSGDAGSTFVVRANGSVVSNRQRSGWALGSGVVESQPALPGDTVFVPENMQYISSTTELKDWAQILYQFGLGALALKNLK